MRFLVLTLLMFAAPAFGSDKIEVGVKGMVCSFCAQGIEKKLKAMGTVEKVNVDLDNKKVSVEPKTGQKIDAEAVKKIIREAGYEVVPPKGA